MGGGSSRGSVSHGFLWGGSSRGSVSHGVGLIGQVLGKVLVAFL